MVTGIIILLISIIIYTGIHIYKSLKLVRDGTHPERKPQLNLDKIPYKTKKFSFESKDGIQLSAIEYIPNQDAKGTIIACHYLGGSKTAIYSYIEPLIASGYTIISFDYPNHGESQDRKGNKYTLEDDARRLIIKLKGQGIKGPFGTIGFSMGATIAISMTDHLPEIKAVVADSGPLIFVKDYFLYVLKNKDVKNKITRIAFLFFYLYVIGFYKMSRKMIKRLKQFDLPILLIHSKKDNIISFKNAECTYSLISSKNKKIIPLEKAHHLTGWAVLGKKYGEMLIEFFDKWLLDNE